MPLLQLSKGGGGTLPLRGLQNAIGSGEYQPDEATRASNLLDVETGMNPTGRREQALRDQEFKNSAAEDAQRLRQLQIRGAESAFLGPQGWDYGTPQDASAARGIDTARKTAALGQELQPMEEGMKDVSAQRAGARYFDPTVASQRESEQGSLLDKISKQYIEPAQIKGQADLGAAELGLEGHEAEAGARSHAADMTNSGNLMDMVTAGMDTKSAPSPEQQQMLDALFRALMDRNKVTTPPAAVPRR